MRRLKLPVMKCDDGCGDCCGVVPVTEEEYDRIKAYIEEKGIKPMRQGITCPLYIGGKCSIYPVRPFICEAFGHSKRMVCPRGYNVNVPERKIHKALNKGGKATRFLHEMAHLTPLEIMALAVDIGVL